MKFTKTSRNAILSVILGDGHLTTSGAVYIKHCLAQLDYLTWKVKFLRSVGVKCNDPKIIDNSGYDGCCTYVNTTKWGKLLRRVIHGQGYKNIYNRKLLNRLDEIHIAIWYMDDGGLSQKKHKGVVHANELFLNTHTTKENNQVIIDYFYDRWGVKFGQVKNKNHYRLRCGTIEARKFLNIVREYVSQVPSMSHKLNIKS